MICVNINRLWFNAHSTVGILTIKDSFDTPHLFTLELPWRNNERKISCIPIGNYKCTRKTSTKNKEWGTAFFVDYVPGRSNIICGHIANKPADLLGCIGFGLYYPQESFIGSSEKAIGFWMRMLEGIDEICLSVVNGLPSNNGC